MARAQILTGFNVNAAEPIDSKLTVGNMADRNALPGVYEGLIVYVRSDNRLWYCIDADNSNLDASWNEIALDTGTGPTITVDPTLTDDGINPVQGGAIKELISIMQLLLTRMYSLTGIKLIQQLMTILRISQVRYLKDR